MRSLRARSSSVVMALCFCLLPFAVGAAESEQAQQRGAAWLAAQVQADGSLSAQAGSTADAVQTRAEVLHALATAAPAALADRVTAELPADTDSAMRRRLALRAAQLGIEPLTSAALRQNSDGGIAPADGYASTPLDTALALLALAREPAADLTIVARALGYLRNSAISGEAYGVHGQSRVAVNALALSAATAWRSRFDIGDIATRAAGWLLAQRDPANAYADVADTALALIALHGHSNDAALLDPLVAALIERQASVGHWNADPFATALAVRALGRHNAPPPPPAGASIVGRLIDGATGQGVADASLRLVELSDAAASSDADGRFGLHGIAAGSYQLRIEVIGYATRELALTVTAGQLLQLGNLVLQPASLGASLSGTVRTSTGAALADVLVAVGTASTTTNGTGFYRLTGLNPGPATISMTRSGYRPLAVDVQLAAGTEHLFSPTMIASSATPPSEASLRGRALSQATGLAIGGATISVGDRSAVSAADGWFTVGQLPIGSFEAQLSATGYATLGFSGSLAGGVNNVGELRMRPIPTSTSLSGTVTDIDDGAPIAGATVSVLGTPLAATSGADGSYRIEGIANTAFRLQVEAADYTTARFDLTVSEHGEHRFDPRLAGAADEGESVYFREVQTDKPVYGPYEEFELEVEVHNPGTVDRELVIDAVVLDAAGEVSFELRANAYGLGQNPPNLPIAIPAGALLEVEMERVLLRQPAGGYTVHVRGYDSQGRVVAQGTAAFTVRSQPLLAGGLVVDPPLLHAGTGQSV
jgi:hypothetical protein